MERAAQFVAPLGTTNGFPTRYHGTWARDVQNHTACFLNAIHLKKTVWCPPSPQKKVINSLSMICTYGDGSKPCTPGEPQNSW